jgi:hypothetical protein
MPVKQRCFRCGTESYGRKLCAACEETLALRSASGGNSESRPPKRQGRTADTVLAELEAQLRLVLTEHGFYAGSDPLPEQVDRALARLEHELGETQRRLALKEQREPPAKRLSSRLSSPGQKRK